jgi:methyl-accepting chemotaxis protein
MNQFDLSLKAKILSGSMITLVLLGIVGIIALSSLTTLTTTNKSVDHTHIVMKEAMKIEAAAVDMETGMRGYLLAGKDGFLDPYTNGWTTFSKLLTDLKKVVDDNPAQVTLLGEIDATIREWRENVTAPAIELRREIGDAKTMNDMADIVGEAKGKKYFDEFREQIALFIEREDKLMTTRMRRAQSANDTGTLRKVLKSVDHTHKVIEEAMKIEAAAVDMETGMRGYLLAGKGGF